MAVGAVRLGLTHVQSVLRASTLIALQFAQIMHRAGCPNARAPLQRVWRPTNGAQHSRAHGLENALEKDDTDAVGKSIDLGQDVTRHEDRHTVLGRQPAQ
jgi:hypothetical protein